MIFLFVQGCGLTVTRPKLEVNMAASAFIAAKEAKANTLAPNLYRKAELYFLKAKSAYKRKYFNKARQYALISRQFSEKAEYVAIKQAAFSGGGFSGVGTAGDSSSSNGGGGSSAPPPPSADSAPSTPPSSGN
ncbi:MAG: DUF4398 domain-containing protein [Oligoflexia bacterium]|nr:DUF4398 domain-containing protein [Oligoflexia bacterium]